MAGVRSKRTSLENPTEKYGTVNSLGTSYSLDRLCADSFGVAAVIGKGEGGGGARKSSSFPIERVTQAIRESVQWELLYSRITALSCSVYRNNFSAVFKFGEI